MDSASTPTPRASASSRSGCGAPCTSLPLATASLTMTNMPASWALCSAAPHEESSRLKVACTAPKSGLPPTCTAMAASMVGGCGCETERPTRDARQHALGLLELPRELRDGELLHLVALTLVHLHTPRRRVLVAPLGTHRHGGRCFRPRREPRGHKLLGEAVRARAVDVPNPGLVRGIQGGVGLLPHGINAAVGNVRAVPEVDVAWPAECRHAEADARQLQLLERGPRGGRGHHCQLRRKIRCEGSASAGGAGAHQHRRRPQTWSSQGLENARDGLRSSMRVVHTGAYLCDNTKRAIGLD
eukprot:scaffold36609_cov70-Phaeocystis_antarctica.AAC.4